jgi:hypothetical protein
MFTSCIARWCSRFAMRSAATIYRCRCGVAKRDGYSQVSKQALQSE